MSHSSRNTSIILAVLFLVITILMMIPSYQLLAKPRQQSFDFYSSWIGGRAILNGQNPYGPEPTRLIQQGIYRKIIPPDEYQHGFALPAHTGLVLLPLMLLPFEWAILIWLGLQIPMFFAALLLGLQILEWPVSPRGLFGLALLTTLGFRYPLVAYSVGQITIFVMLCVTLSMWLFGRGHPTLAALALAGSTIRPDMALPALLLSLILTWRSPHRKHFLLTLAAVGGGLLLIPILFTGDIWPLTWLQQVTAYGNRNPFNTWPPGLLPTWAAALLAAGVLLWLMFYLRRVWLVPSARNLSLLTSAGILAGLLLLPQTGAYTLSLALIPALILLRYAPNRLKILIAAGLLTPWLWFWLDFERAIFLLIPLQFVAMQMLVSYSRRRYT